MFQSTNGRGFLMRFQNGFSVSVQWGVLNLCERENLDEKSYNEELNTKASDILWKSNDAEVAVLDSENNFVPFGFGLEQLGRIYSDEVSRLISIVSSATDKAQLEKSLSSFVVELEASRPDSEESQEIAQ